MTTPETVRIGSLTPPDAVEGNREWAEVLGAAGRILPLAHTAEWSRIDAELAASLPVDVVVRRGTDVVGDEDAAFLAWARDRGIPATTARVAVDSALDALGARDVALVTPYDVDTEARVAARYSTSARVVAPVPGLGVVDRRHHGDIAAGLLVAIAEAALAVRSFDTVLISCGNLAAREAIAEIESRWGVACVSTNSALLFHALTRARIEVEITGYGRLFPKGSG